jgi:alpha-tubulin suppressor-like RCC1 family protein
MFTLLSNIRLNSCLVLFVFLSATFTAHASLEGQWLQVSAGSSYSIAIKVDGSLWAWGSNGSGQLGDGTTAVRRTPTQIGSDNNWQYIAAGEFHSLAIKSDGTLWAWGQNDYGQLGDDTTTERHSPTQIGSDTNWQRLAGGNSHSLAIKSDGTLWAWGRNNEGQLGNGTYTDRPTPTQTGDDNNWRSIATLSGHSLAIKTDGSLWIWGRIHDGQLGGGAVSNEPLQIGSDTNWDVISVGGEHSLAIKTDGTLWAWGYNGSGQLGDGTTTNRTSPTQIGSDNNWQSIASGWSHSLAIKSDGTLWVWGHRAGGLLGDDNRIAPMQIRSDTKWQSITTLGHSLAIKSDGTLWAWGRNLSGQLGFDYSGSVFYPVQGAPYLKMEWQLIAAGGAHSLAIKIDGTLWAWGSNSQGQLGDNTTTQRNAPVQIGSDNNWQYIAAGSFHSFAIKTDGSLWAWGSNGSGQLGDGTTTDKRSPTQVGSDSNWQSLAAGSLQYILAIKTDGTLWAWGRNSEGQLGDGTTTQRNTPVQIGSDSNWQNIGAGYTHSLATRLDGSLWAWGRNHAGRLGDGTETDRRTPTQIGYDNNWQVIAAGNGHSLALKSDGTLWTWGSNFAGQLGDGNFDAGDGDGTPDRWEPAQMGTKEDWQSIEAGSAHSLAIRTDGTLWLWGLNGEQNYPGANIITPAQQIGKDSNWWRIAASGHSLALESSGALWTWGRRNESGQLGDGTTDNRNEPKQMQLIDSDGDGQPDVLDVFPHNATEYLDFDTDGIGNNADTDDDNDGISDEYELANNLNPLRASDALLDNDGDGIVALDEYLLGSFDNNASDVPANVNFVLYSFETAICQSDFSGDASWRITNTAAYNGNQSHQVTGLENGGTASLRYQHTFNAGYFSFILKTSTEAQYDKLILSVDNIEIARYSGESDWTLYRFAITEGPHSISWDYTKDSSGSAGDDAIWIDSIVLPVNTDLDNNGIHNETRTDDDCDGYLDLDEIAAGSDPLRASSLPLDTDGDFISNATDLDDDNDGILDTADAYPLVTIGDLPDTDTDNDGAPNDCDEGCAALGMTADSDDDNDGLVDTADAYPLVAIANLLDTDGDGAPNDCDDSCVASGMVADSDDDNDGVLDTDDDFPLEATETVDTDGDRIGNNADADDDNDGIADTDDAFTLIAIGDLTDTDNDGAPDACDVACTDLGMTADTDDDNDGVLDADDAFSLFAIGDLTDTDNDGAPDVCDVACTDLGMTADADDDNDGVLDADDAFSLFAIGDLTDTDNDGAPDACDVACTDLGMTADTDDDNDALPDDYEIANALNPLLPEDAALDVDSDGLSNYQEFLANTDPNNSDSDQDGILDAEDSAPLDNTQGDTVAPVFAALQSLTIEAMAEFTDVNTYLPDVTDNSGLAPVVTSNYPMALSLGEYQFTWSATDSQGNTSTSEQVVNIVDTTAPVFDDILSIEVAATGKLTDIASAINLVAFDVVDGDVTAQLVGNGIFESGLRQIEVTAADASGNQAISLVEVAIHPITQLGIDVFGEPGATAYLQVSLSGEPAAYPVSVDYSLDGAAFGSASFGIDSGSVLKIPIVVPDNTIDGDIILLTLDSAENAVLGEKLSANIQVQQSNVAPIVEIMMEQGGKRVAVVDVSAGDVTVSAIVKDINLQDVHLVEWTESELGMLTGQSVVLDSAQLAVGTHSLIVTATETNTSALQSVQNSLSFVVTSQLATLDTSDTDGDGIVDSDEGYGDSDGDGIPDFKDANNDAAQLPLGQEVILAEAGITLSVGTVAQLLSEGLPDGAGVDEQLLSDAFGADLANNTGFSAIDGIVSFKATGLAIAGGSMSFGLPLPSGATLPANTVYRKFFITQGWSTFVADAENRIASAQRINGSCPVPGSLVYQAGLNEGDDCIELTLVDGGIYDADGEANGSIEDPGVFAVVNQAPIISIVGTDSLQEGSQISLDAAATTDPENNSLTFEWNVLEGPLLIVGAATNQAVSVQGNDVQGDSSGLIELVVSDGSSTVSQQYSLSVLFVNQLPTVSLSSVSTANEGTTITLTAAGADPDGQALTYLFEQVSGDTASIASDGGLVATVVLPDVTQTRDIVFRVTATDSSGGGVSSDATILVVNVAVTTPPPPSSGGDGGGGGSLYDLLFLMGLICFWRALGAHQILRKPLLPMV